MTGLALPAEPYTLGLDCLETVPEGVAEKAFALGYRFIGRYLETLTPPERDRILGARMAILPLIEMRVANLLTGTFGQNVGADSVRRAMAVGVPQKVHLVTDLEATAGADPRDVCGYANGVGSVVLRGGYGSMLYVGAGQPLSGEDLYHLVSGPYWRGASLGIPEIAHVGWTMLQLSPLEGVVLRGHKFDASVIQADARGRTPMLWWPDSP